ncbi:MAG: cytochrome c [Hyphomicrobium sp.]
MADRKTLRLTAGVLMASALAAVLGCGAAGIATAEDKKAEAAAPNAVEGGRTFTRYCALCHGLDGAGLGPLAESLQKAPPDLTRISERNGGTFPDDKVQQIIEHGGVKSHGMMAMLAWGKVFNEDIGKDQQARVIGELAAYIKTLQGR